MGIFHLSSTFIFCDYQCTIQIAYNDVFHECKKPLPVVEYAYFIRRFKVHEEQDDDNVTCVICLNAQFQPAAAQSKDIELVKKIKKQKEHLTGICSIYNTILSSEVRLRKHWQKNEYFLALRSKQQFFLKEAFTHLGLFKPLPEEDHYSANHSSGYVLLMDSRSRSLVPVPVQVLTEMIKKNLPVLEYGVFIERFGDDEQVVNTVCTVCLDSMEKSDEIRELCMCSHVFHKECLDTWVNEGQVTCPLCRSTLYPERIDWTGRATGSWITNHDADFN
ncbi:uncharacterized protein LOC111302747 [Durio zibethinus]|uniref:Uncharacterized protein LOC111302747 n=1 Tax=Durio zibethinus TaxID=66656 RepID=A0A6P5ZPF5_DURZI|nr:uncharacterized protein LOC111302747 [Durio zibethinus]